MNQSHRDKTPLPPVKGSFGEGSSPSYQRRLGFLFVGGEYPARSAFEHLFQDSSLVVAADSGFDATIALGIQADYIVGDMDSCSKTAELSSFPKERIFAYPHDKDETDTELGLSLLHHQGINETVIVGGGGGRLDHLLAIISLFKRRQAPDHWFTEREYVTPVEGEVRFFQMKGRTISFFPLDSLCTMKTEGLKWPLDSLSWGYGDCGVSNIGVEDTVTIRMKTGKLLAIMSLDERGSLE